MDATNLQTLQTLTARSDLAVSNKQQRIIKALQVGIRGHVAGELEERTQLGPQLLTVLTHPPP